MQYIVICKSIDAPADSVKKMTDFPQAQILAQEVDKHLKDGFKPKGGIAVFFDQETRRVVFYQAMYKAEKS